MDKKPRATSLWDLLGWVNTETSFTFKLWLTGCSGSDFFGNAINNIGKKSFSVRRWYEKI